MTLLALEENGAPFFSHWNEATREKPERGEKPVATRGCGA